MNFKNIDQELVCGHCGNNVRTIDGCCFCDKENCFTRVVTKREWNIMNRVPNALVK